MSWFRPYRVWGLVVMALLNAPIGVVAQERPSPEPYAAEVIAGTNIPALERLIPMWMEQAAIPGLQAAVISGGDVIWHRAFGVKNARTGVLLDDETRFDGASLIKPIIAYAVMRLVERGLFELDQPLTGYRPFLDVENTFFTTAADYARLVAAVMLSTGLSAESQAAMFTPHIAFDKYCAPQPDYRGWPNCIRVTGPQDPSGDAFWALGWGLEKTPAGDAFRQWGDQGLYRHYVVGFLDQQVAVVYLTNGFHGFALRDVLIDQSIGGRHPALDWLPFEQMPVNWNLTQHPASDRRPAWSPDGSLIAFETNRDGDWEIYLMQADGTAPRRLTDNPASDRRPSFSPDGTHVVFQSDRDGDEEIFVMRSDGSALRKLTDNQAEDMFPAWSPDGAFIAFISDRDGDLEIYRMHPDGSAQQRLTTHEHRDLWPAWSPDGAGLAFFSRRDSDDDNDELYSISSDGTGVRRLTTHPAHDFCPSWSPDGRRLVFASLRDGSRAQLYILNVGDLTVNKLTEDPGRATEPSWSPDEKRIAFTSNRDGNNEIYVVILP